MKNVYTGIVVKLHMKKLSFVREMVGSPVWLEKLIELSRANQTHQQSKTQKHTEKQRHRFGGHWGRA